MFRAMPYTVIVVVHLLATNARAQEGRPADSSSAISSVPSTAITNADVGKDREGIGTDVSSSQGTPTRNAGNGATWPALLSALASVLAVAVALAAIFLNYWFQQRERQKEGIRRQLDEFYGPVLQLLGSSQSPLSPIHEMVV